MCIMTDLVLYDEQYSKELISLDVTIVSNMENKLTICPFKT